MKKIMVLMVLCLMSAQQIPLNGMSYQKLNDENKNESNNQSEKNSLYSEVKNGENEKLMALQKEQGEEKLCKFIKILVEESIAIKGKTSEITDEDVENIFLGSSYRADGKNSVHSSTLKKAFQKEKVDDSSLIYAIDQIEKDLEKLQKARAVTELLVKLGGCCLVGACFITSPCWLAGMVLFAIGSACVKQ